MAASTKIETLWDMAPCSLVEVARRFRGAYCVHRQGDDGGSSSFFVLSAAPFSSSSPYLLSGILFVFLPCLLFSFSIFFLLIALMMEAVRNSETSAYYNETTRLNVPEDYYLRTRRRENLKFHNLFRKSISCTQRVCSFS
jgi:hypothetical protein